MGVTIRLHTDPADCGLSDILRNSTLIVMPSVSRYCPRMVRHDTTLRLYTCIPFVPSSLFGTTDGHKMHPISMMACLSVMPSVSTFLWTTYPCIIEKLLLRDGEDHDPNVSTVQEVHWCSMAWPCLAIHLQPKISHGQPNRPHESTMQGVESAMDGINPAEDLPLAIHLQPKISHGQA
jgi:hypothetical protein